MISIDWLRVVSLCVLLAGAETLHGIARTVLLAPRVGKAMAIRLSVGGGSLLAFGRTSTRAAATTCPSGWCCWRVCRWACGGCVARLDPRRETGRRRPGPTDRRHAMATSHLLRHAEPKPLQPPLGTFEIAALETDWRPGGVR